MRLIDKLHSGGVIVTYACSAACGHCLYKSSPRRDNSFMSPETAELIFAKIASLGCRCVHIGGGEPFLSPTKLAEVCHRAAASGVSIEYIETNASWAGTDGSKTRETIEKIMQAGVDTLLISISPFHNQFVPFAKTKALIAACRDAGMGVFPWISDFIGDISRLDTDKTHPLSEYEDVFGVDFVNSLPARYSVRMGGRAIHTYHHRMPTRTAREISYSNPGPCKEPFNTSHFHADLYGNYIPGSCAGMALALDNLGKEADDHSYPIFKIMTTGGISELLKLAKDTIAFDNNDTYLGKCHLCNDIRTALSKRNLFKNELQPAEFYSE